MDFSSFDLWSFLGGLVGGVIGGSLITLQVKKSQSVEGSGTVVDQANARAGGDNVGRDKKTS